MIRCYWLIMTRRDQLNVKTNHKKIGTRMKSSSVYESSVRQNRRRSATYYILRKNGIELARLSIFKGIQTMHVFEKSKYTHKINTL